MAKFVVKEARTEYFTYPSAAYSSSKTNDNAKASEIEKEKEYIYSLVKENGNYTVKDISRIMGISIASAQRRLQALQDDKRIRRIGSKKSGKWEILQ